MSRRRLHICLLLSDPFTPEMPSRPEVTEIYGEFIPSFGHKVTWITPTRERRARVATFRKARVYMVPFRSVLFPLKILNVISYHLRRYKIITRILKEEKLDVIQVRNDVLASLLALLVRRKYGVPFVFQYSFAKGAHRWQRPGKLSQHYFGEMESRIINHVLHRADLVFPISKWMETKLLRDGIPKAKMMPLPMGVNPELFSPRKDGREIRNRLKLGDSKIILYVGTFDELRSLDIVIHSFSRVREHAEKVKLVLVGDGDGRANLEKLAATLGIETDVIFVGQVAYSDVPYYIAASDICLSPIPPLPIYEVSSPTKLFEYMAMGKPVVANEEIPEQKEVIEGSGAGVLVRFEAESIAEGIVGLLNSPETAKEIGRKGLKWVVENRSYENISRELEEKYFELMDLDEKRSVVG